MELPDPDTSKSAKTQIKIVYNGEPKRITVSEEIDIDQLKKEAQEAFTKLPEHYIFQYHDGEHKIKLESDKDLQNGFIFYKSFLKEEKKWLQLEIVTIQNPARALDISIDAPLKVEDPPKPLKSTELLSFKGGDCKWNVETQSFYRIDLMNESFGRNCTFSFSDVTNLENVDKGRDKRRTTLCEPAKHPLDARDTYYVSVTMHAVSLRGTSSQDSVQISKCRTCEKSNDCGGRPFLIGTPQAAAAVKFIDSFPFIYCKMNCTPKVGHQADNMVLHIVIVGSMVKYEGRYSLFYSQSKTKGKRPKVIKSEISIPPSQRIEIVPSNTETQPAIVPVLLGIEPQEGEVGQIATITLKVSVASKDIAIVLKRGREHNVMTPAKEDWVSETQLLCKIPSPASWDEPSVSISLRNQAGESQSQVFRFKALTPVKPQVLPFIAPLVQSPKTPTEMEEVMLLSQVYAKSLHSKDLNASRGVVAWLKILALQNASLFHKIMEFLKKQVDLEKYTWLVQELRHKPTEMVKAPEVLKVAEIMRVPEAMKMVERTIQVVDKVSQPDKVSENRNQGILEKSPQLSIISVPDRQSQVPDRQSQVPEKLAQDSTLREVPIEKKSIEKLPERVKTPDKMVSTNSTQDAHSVEKPTDLPKTSQQPEMMGFLDELADNAVQLLHSMETKVKIQQQVKEASPLGSQTIRPSTPTNVTSKPYPATTPSPPPQMTTSTITIPPQSQSQSPLVPLVMPSNKIKVITPVPKPKMELSIKQESGQERPALFGFKRPMGPYQSSGHIVKDNEDRFIEIQCSDIPFITTHFGKEAVETGRRAITCVLWDEEGSPLQELQVIAGTIMVITEFSQDTVTIKPKLPNLGATTHTLYLFIELHLLHNHRLIPYAGEWFPFQRFHHLNELPPEELKKTGKRMRNKKENERELKKSRMDD